MFLLVHKNMVLVGPMDWNKAMFTVGAKRKKIDHYFPFNPPDTFPYIIDNDTKVVKCQLVYQNYDKRTEYLHGPFWNFDQDEAIGTFEIKETPIDQVKGMMKLEVADERYKKEISGTKTTIQSLEVSVDTNRGSRDIFVQKYLLMGENDTVQWKFPEGWLTLTKTDLGQIVAAGAAHIQTAFNWEKNLADTIDATTTYAELKNIVIVEPPVQNNPPV